MATPAETRNLWCYDQARTFHLARVAPRCGCLEGGRYPCPTCLADLVALVALLQTAITRSDT